MLVMVAMMVVVMVMIHECSIINFLNIENDFNQLCDG